MAFALAAKASEVAPGTIREVKVGSTMVALANVGGAFYAINNTCLHRGGPLGQGALESKTVTCPWHGWQYDVTTGKASMNPNVGVACYATEIRDDEVFVDVG